MNYKDYFLSFFLAVALPIPMLVSTSIDAKKSPAWITTSWDFVDADTVDGFVYLKNGFTIVGEPATVLFNTCGTIDGLIQTRAYDILKLNNDLIFGSDIKFIESITIDGCGHTLSMTSNLEIPDHKSFILVSDTIIDGHGCTITLPTEKSLVIGQDVQLTLKNIHVNILSPEALHMQTDSSSLILENSTLTLNVDQAIVTDVEMRSAEQCNEQYGKGVTIIDHQNSDAIK